MIPAPYDLIAFKPGDRWEYKNSHNQIFSGEVVRIYVDDEGESFLIVNYDHDYYYCECCFYFEGSQWFNHFPK